LSSQSGGQRQKPLFFLVEHGKKVLQAASSGYDHKYSLPAEE